MSWIKRLSRLSELFSIWSYFFLVFGLIITSSTLLIVARVFQESQCKTYDLLMQLAATGIIVGYFGALIGFVLFFFYYLRRFQFFA